MNRRFAVPILFIVFNRPELTRIVCEAIKQIRPQSLFVAADGPRKHIIGEIENCRKVRQLFHDFDWDCELHTLFRDENLGCKTNVSSAISWFFEHVQEGIILEDDCLPDLSFFRFCEELLDYYRDNDRIMMISGGNYQFGENRTDYSYYFSRYCHVWGWATWRDRWQLYDVLLSQWPKINKREFFNHLIDDKNEVAYWSEIFNRVYENKIDTWDYQLLFSCWMNKRLSIIPNENMISNIGFGCSATHTRNNSPFAGMKTSSMNFPLKHPGLIERNLSADALTSRTQYRRFLLKKIKAYIKRRMQRLFT